MKNFETMGVQEMSKQNIAQLNGGGFFSGLLIFNYKIGTAMLGFAKGVWDTFNDGFSDGYLHP